MLLALPVRMDGQELASFVLNRQGRDFSDCDWRCLTLCAGRWRDCSIVRMPTHGPLPALDNEALRALG